LIINALLSWHATGNVKANSNKMTAHSTLKIFLVDDDSFSTELNRQLLSNLGYTDISVFTDGQTCLNHLVEQPAVVFVDHNMEPMDGLALLKKIKRFDPQIFTVFVSGQEQMEVAVDALKYGAFDYIIKGEQAETRIAAVMAKIIQVRATFAQQQKKGWRKFMPVFQLAVLAFLALAMSSCSSQNMLQKDPSIQEDSTVFVRQEAYQYTIRKDDKVSISVWDHDDLSVGSIYGIYNSNEVYGKWLMVDANGKIPVPQVGEVQAENMTVIALEESLRIAYSKFIKQPIVEVKVLNKEVTILGELKTPGKYLLEKEENTLVELLGKAGDFDFYADRAKVMVVRIVNGQPKSITVDLTQLSNYAKSNVYLLPGDVVYVPSRKAKVWDKRSGSIVVPATAIITTAVLVATTLK
jgi:polysaccharide biosynthesis/export protein